MAASEAWPTPASTITGTFDCSLIIFILILFWIPNPEPIGAAKGMMADAPTSSNFCVIIGSSVQYTIVLKPSLTNTSVDLIVSIIFGYNVFLSPNTSSLTNFHPPISLANLNTLRAS